MATPNINTDILINPYNFQKLHLNGECLSDESGNVIPVNKGIPDFLSLEETTGLNKKYRKFYNKVSNLNDLAEAIYSMFMNLTDLRTEWMEELDVKPGYAVLETSIGTGWNIKVLPKHATFYGLDISEGMLKQCRKNCKRWNIPVQLFHGNAEYLPFRDESFDSVFHVGGINFFNDRQRAINEMIRVAKPGTKIVIIDETREYLKKQYQKTPFVKKYFRDDDLDSTRLLTPVDLVPINMKEIEVKILEEHMMYQLSFRKPSQSN